MVAVMVEVLAPVMVA